MMTYSSPFKTLSISLLVFIFVFGISPRVLNLTCMANGGPIDGSSVYSTGDVRLIQNTGVKLLAEDLNIKIEGDYSHIQVIYSLQNQSKYRDLDITYGFPVAFGINEMEQFAWDSSLVPQFQFSLDGKALPFTEQTDIAIINTGQKHPNYNYEIQVRNHWFITAFSIPKQTAVMLKVDYRIKNGFEDSGTSKDFFPYFGERQLYYDFHAASFWGNGEVEKMTIKVDATAVFGDFEVQGVTFKQQKKVYTFFAENFPLNEADPLLITYQDDDYKMAEFMKSHEMPREKLLAISASSSLEGNYQPENLFDRKLETAWVEGQKGYGIGESITFTLDNYKLGAIAIINGYPKSMETYFGNGRIKKLKVERLISGKWYGDEVNLEELFDKRPEVLYQVIGQYGEGFTPVEKVRLTILEVFPSNKYEDTCIAEIMFLGFWND